jgi:hypothetical protein
VTPSNSISKTQDMAESGTSPRRTLRNELYTSRLSSYVVEEDLRTSSPNLSFTSLTEERPSLVSRRPATRPALQNNVSVFDNCTYWLLDCEQFLQRKEGLPTTHQETKYA